MITASLAFSLRFCTAALMVRCCWMSRMSSSVVSDLESAYTYKHKHSAAQTPQFKNTPINRHFMGTWLQLAVR